ncbi:MAG TPA: hypothetical protein VHH34_14390 [Pseudonocardiaceae bacterium]|nr:hypothetical protein [Pseudonocardiaceae bacterium]
MKVRITGTPDECAQAVTVLGAVLAVREISGFYPNSRGPGGLGRVYLDTEAPTAAAADPVRGVAR